MRVWSGVLACQFLFFFFFFLFGCSDTQYEDTHTHTHTDKERDRGGPTATRTVGKVLGGEEGGKSCRRGRSRVEGKEESISMVFPEKAKTQKDISSRKKFLFPRFIIFLHKFFFWVLGVFFFTTESGAKRGASKPTSKPASKQASKGGSNEGEREREREEEKRYLFFFSLFFIRWGSEEVERSLQQQEREKTE